MPAILAPIRRRSGRRLLNRVLQLCQRPLIRTAVALTTLGTISACGGGGDTPVTPVVTPGFAVALSSSTLTVTAGSTATISATITRTGAAGTVSLSAEGLPTGVSATFNPADISATTTSASLSVVAAASAAPGTYTFGVRARGNGIADQVIPATVTVRAAPAFTLSINPASATVQAGTSTQATVQLARTEFTDAVALSLTGLPTGVTATLGAASITAESTTLTIATTAATTPGVYPLTVTATSSLAARTATFTLTVMAAQDFSIVPPAALSVRQGTVSTAQTVAVTRTGGFTGPVTLTFEGLPTGVTATPASVAVTGASGQFTLTAAANATVGLATVTVRAKAAGTADRVATFALTVTADPGSFSIFASAITQTAQGQTGTSTITLTRVAPFAGSTALTVSGLPAGVTSAFAPTTIAAGSTTSTLALAVASSTAPGVYPLVVRATGAGVPDATVAVSLTVTAAVSPLISQHLIAQQGLAIALASTVLQSQLRVLVAVTSTGEDSAQPCEALPGGGAVQSLPVGANNPTRAGIYYDAACTKPYILANVTAQSTSGGKVTLTETATYYGPTGTLLGTMNLQETGDIDGSPISVAGLGTFTPANGAQPVRLGLTCEFIEGAVTTAPCYGGIEQYVPSLARAVGSVTPLTLTLGANENSPITFTGSGSVTRTGAQGSLTLSFATPTSLAVSGGTVFGTSTQQGSAANFSLFPPTPTGWTVTDTEHDMRFSINVVSNTVRNSVGQITQLSTGAVLATIAVDQSGTGTITWSDGRTVAVTSWMFAD